MGAIPVAPGPQSIPVYKCIVNSSQMLDPKQGNFLFEVFVLSPTFMTVVCFRINKTASTNHNYHNILPQTK